ncbi:MAG: hypothetical protein KDK05_27160, partial [Candidatus Competibacteraceae bacterium]|nr:hypothetical protein [Candidatus Competibacteraceae bacterium]
RQQELPGPQGVCELGTYSDAAVPDAGRAGDRMKQELCKHCGAALDVSWGRRGDPTLVRRHRLSTLDDNHIAEAADD